MEIPKNVVQTGDVDACHKIYIEDYVHTYLMQSRERDGSSDFCLYGKGEVENGVHYYFIFGAIMEDAGWETDGRRYFSQWEQIGESTCDENEAWLFFSDGYASPMDGYFIFYEQNEDMQAYLIAMHQNRPAEDADSMRSSARTGKKLPDTKMTQEMAVKQAAALSGRKIIGGRGSSDTRKMPNRMETSEDRKHSGSLKAAEIKRPSFRDRAALQRKTIRPAAKIHDPKDRSRTIYFIRLASVALLLAVCAAGVISVNRYKDMKEAGNLFAGAAQELDREKEDMNTSVAAVSLDKPGSFVVEEKQIQAGEEAEAQVAADETQATTAQTPATAQTPDTAQAPDTAQTQATAADSGQIQASEAQPSDKTETNNDEVPAASVEEQSAVSAMSVDVPETYTIQSGDNLAAISRRFYGNPYKINDICSLNNISDPNRITPGQKIILPR